MATRTGRTVSRKRRTATKSSCERRRPLRVPKLYNLRTDPFERADITSNTYYDWFLYHDYIALAANMIAAEFLATFKEFLPRQRAASFTIDQAMEKMEASISGAGH